MDRLRDLGNLQLTRMEFWMKIYRQGGRAPRVFDCMGIILESSPFHYLEEEAVVPWIFSPRMSRFSIRCEMNQGMEDLFWIAADCGGDIFRAFSVGS
jgi:hypothetical protein